MEVLADVDGGLAADRTEAADVLGYRRDRRTLTGRDMLETILSYYPFVSNYNAYIYLFPGQGPSCSSWVTP